MWASNMELEVCGENFQEAGTYVALEKRARDKQKRNTRAIAMMRTYSKDSWRLVQVPSVGDCRELGPPGLPLIWHIRSSTCVTLLQRGLQSTCIAAQTVASTA